MWRERGPGSWILQGVNCVLVLAIRVFVFSHTHHPQRALPSAPRPCPAYPSTWTKSLTPGDAVGAAQSVAAARFRSLLETASARRVADPSRVATGHRLITSQSSAAGLMAGSLVLLVLPTRAGGFVSTAVRRKRG